VAAHGARQGFTLSRGSGKAKFVVFVGRNGYEFVEFQYGFSGSIA